jgi:hypothetical protein
MELAQFVARDRLGCITCVRLGIDMQTRIDWVKMASEEVDGNTTWCLAIIVSWQRLRASGGVQCTADGALAGG